MEQLQEEYIIYCDESAKKGKYFGNFYGGAIVNAKQIDKLNILLNQKKEELNLFGEIKWSKVTESYLDKYIEIIDLFFDYIKTSDIKIRIMFKPVCYIANDLTDNQIDNEYYLFYYQFVKWAFGFENSNPKKDKELNIRFYFDKLPNTPNRNNTFIDFVYGLNNVNIFKDNNIHIRRENIAEVISHDHVILQCMDIILGSINFRLNNFHKEKLPNSNRRGKKTIAKEKLYKHILIRIREIHHNFNIGVSTGLHDWNTWTIPYRHWKFIPSNSTYYSELTKKQ